MGVLFPCYDEGKGGYMDEEAFKTSAEIAAANEKLKEDIAIGQQIRKNVEEWSKTRSVSLAFETMELLVKIIPKKEEE